MLAGLEASAATPAPANEIFDVEPNTIARSGLPAAAQALSTLASWSPGAYRSWTAYALSQNRRKSAAAVFIDARALTTLSLYVVPVGLLYFGTHHMPLIAGSLATRRSTSAKSGPSSCKATLSISMP